MQTTIEKMDDNKARFTFSVDAERFEEGIKFSYNKNKSRLRVQGFRKGKAPRKVIEIQYGKEIFYDDAVNHILPDAYEAAARNSGLEIVSKPKIDVKELEPETGVVFLATVTTKPEVEVKDYNGITYNKFEGQVTEEDVLNEIDKDREKNAREITITDRPIQDGDIAVIDYSGFVDGVPFEGGEGGNHELKIGSHTFIDTFEEQLIGHNVEDEVDVNVTFPEEYHAEDLAGKKAVFHVKINEIKFKELPELNDDFAADVSEFDTLSEYKENIRTKLEAAMKYKEKSDKEAQVMNALIAMTEINLPQIMIENQIDVAVQNFSNNIRRQGIPLDMYLEYMGQTMKSLRDIYRKSSEEQVRGRLCLEAVAKAENIEISEQELENEITRMAQEYNMEREKLMGILDTNEKKSLALDLKVQKALELLVERAVCVE